MINILFVSAYLAQNGTEMFMMNVLRHSNPNEYHFDFLINSDSQTPNRKEAESKGCKVFVIPFRKEGIIRSFRACWAFYKEHAKDYDAIHWCGGNLSSIDSLLIAKLFKIPIIIVHAHSSSAVGIHNIILHYINRLFIRRIGTHFLACSTQASSFFFKQVPVVVINNGIDIELFDFKPDIRRKMRMDFSLSAASFAIGHVGRFDDNKNQSFLIDAFTEVLKEKDNAQLFLIGDGVTLKQVKAYAIKKGIEEKIHFLGMRRNVNEIMQALDCFVMPSKFEGLPFVLVEAQCSGLPCVISDTINHDVDITGNVTFLSLNKQSTEWSNVILKTINSFNRKPMGWKIKEQGFSIKDTVAYLEKIYSQKSYIL